MNSIEFNNQNLNDEEMERVTAFRNLGYKRELERHKEKLANGVFFGLNDKEKLLAYIDFYERRCAQTEANDVSNIEKQLDAVFNN